MHICSEVNTADGATDINLSCIDHPAPHTYKHTQIQGVASCTFEQTTIIAEIRWLDKMPIFCSSYSSKNRKPHQKKKRGEKEDWCEAKQHRWKMRCYFFSTSQYVFIKRQIQVSSLFCHLVFSQSGAGVCRYGTHRREANKTAGRGSCRLTEKQPLRSESKHMRLRKHVIGGFWVLQEESNRIKTRHGRQEL